MKKEVINVPRNINPLELLEQMGEKVENSWIFLRNNVTVQLAEYADVVEIHDDLQKFTWKKTRYSDEVVIILQTNPSVWARVTFISANNVLFTKEPEDPESIYFFKIWEF